MKGKIKITEGEIKHILQKHKLSINESVKLTDFVTSDMSSESPNFKSFIEFLNGNIDVDTIANDVNSFIKTTTTPIVNSNTDDVKILGGNRTDDEFYKEVLSRVGAKPTKENMKFFYAWRQAEGSKSTFNPFNTTHKKEGSSFWNCLKKKSGKCLSGVRNYKTEEDGIDATASTIKNGYYPCIVDGLKNDIGAKNIAEKCLSNLKTWGTGGLVKTILNSKTLNPPAISRTLVKKV